MSLRSESLRFWVAIAFVVAPATLGAQSDEGDPSAVPVTVKTFARAESDMYFAGAVKQGAFGRFKLTRVPDPY
jgi:hypothetical protein